MPTSNTSLFSRIKRREAEAGGAIPQPRKKSRSAGASTSAGTGGPGAGASTICQGRTRDAGDTGPTAPICPAPVAQRGRPTTIPLRRPGPGPTGSPEVPSSDEPSSSRAPREKSAEPGSPLLEGSSAIHDAEVARAVFRRAMLPADWAEFANLPLEEIVDGTYRNTARHIHEVDTLVFIAQGCQEETRRVSRQLEPAKKRIAELEAALAEAEARRETTEAGRLALVEVLEEERAAHSLAKSALRASETRLGEAQSEIAGLKYEGGVFRLKIEQLEAREKKALERAENAVELFKESEEFRDMLEEETVDGFLRGFENFWRQMARPPIRPLHDSSEDEVGLWLRRRRS
ncbi:uncharacterized protein LOC120105316 [Phoenix dactylifera]|uniref:Uncharacterized protein LOC120105316 n=1 Tax=Phoenix dactylifera TaxID=42345 RepID=A0A8B8ZHF1_PHODC|nr:uncharacterized protein LOC120105316 [Phoenix dactylifera]